MRKYRLLGVVLALLAVAPAARAERKPGAGVATWSFLRFAGKKELRVRIAWTAHEAKKPRTARVFLRAGDSNKAVELYQGTTVRGDVAARAGSALIALIHGGSKPLIRFLIADLSGAEVKTKNLSVPRPVDSEHSPASVVATADADGYTVLWQEESTRDPGADVRTYFTRVSPSGKFLVKPKAVEVPWALAAIAWDGHGYHLGAYYDGAGPAETRLAVVTLDEQGQPREHPWWASAQGEIGEVQLVHVGKRVIAFYRGGASGRDLDSSDVTAVGQWGVEPTAATRHGAIADNESFGVQASGAKSQLVKRRAAAFE